MQDHIEFRTVLMARLAMEDRERIDRLGMRARPEGDPVMHQRWEDLLFLHWALDPAELRPLIPAAFEPDTYNSQAWIGVTPFHLEDVRPSALGSGFPGLNSFHELNVRTYVLHGSRPGVLFFSLDASKLVPAAAARILFMLPYYKASMRFSRNHPEFHFPSRRVTGPAAEFNASWKVGVRLRDPAVDSLAFFLVERYAAFTVSGDTVYEVPIYHHPWILDEAQVEPRSSSMISALGLREPTTDPLAHFAASQDVEIWPPKVVGKSIRAPATA